MAATTGTVANDTPERVIQPMSVCFKAAKEAMSKEIKLDPTPEFSSQQIAETTEWLKSVVEAMQMHNDGFTKHGLANLDDEALQRNQALARESSRRLNLLFADASGKFGGKRLNSELVTFAEGGQSKEVRQKLADFVKFFEHFGQAKWLGGLVAPEFQEHKDNAMKLLNALQNPSQTLALGCDSAVPASKPCIYDGMSSEGNTSAAELMKLARMAEFLAEACRADSEARAKAEVLLVEKMSKLKAFAEAISEVPDVFRRFVLLCLGSLKEDARELKEWVGHDEATSVHQQLEEFRDDAAEEKVIRRIKSQMGASSASSWILASQCPSEPASDMSHSA